MRGGSGIGKDGATSPMAVSYTHLARSTDEVEEEKLRRLLGRLNSYAESNLHDWLNKQPEPGIWCRTVGSGAQPREGGAPDE